MLPSLAKQADKYSIIRSMTHGNNGHETAAYIVQTGRQPDRLSWPGLGAIVSAFKGYDHGYTGLIPPYVVLTTTQGRFSECGFLGPKYKPFATGGDPQNTLRRRGRDRRGHQRRAPETPPRPAAPDRHARPRDVRGPPVSTTSTSARSRPTR
jgi:hypothetical protein